MGDGLRTTCAAAGGAYASDVPVSRIASERAVVSGVAISPPPPPPPPPPPAPPLAPVVVEIVATDASDT